MGCGLDVRLIKRFTKCTIKVTVDTEKKKTNVREGQILDVAFLMGYAEMSLKRGFMQSVRRAGGR